MSAKKITSAIAILGAIILIISIIGRFLGFIPFGLRNVMLIVGLTCMFLGTIWKVVIEMNEGK